MNITLKQGETLSVTVEAKDGSTRDLSIHSTDLAAHVTTAAGGIFTSSCNANQHDAAFFIAAKEV